MDDKKQVLLSFSTMLVVDSGKTGAVVDRKQAIASSCDGKKPAKQVYTRWTRESRQARWTMWKRQTRYARQKR
eukprot:8856124-Ditylum_brightwellii.AAC.1